MSASLRRTLAATLAVLALAAIIAPAAMACTQQCVRYPAGGFFCRVCEDVGYYTGATCEQNGPCGCYYTQNTCGLYADAETSTEDALFVDADAQCTVDSTAVASLEVAPAR